MSKNQRGFSIVEAMIALGIMGVGVTAFMTMHQNQTKANLQLEFQLKKIQFQNYMTGDFLKDGSSCGCLFNSAAPFPSATTAPGITIGGPAVPVLGRYQFTTPGDCSTATIPMPIADTKGLNDMNIESIQLRKVQNVSGNYLGEMVVKLNSTKSVLGPKDGTLFFPVNLSVTPVGTDVKINGCSSAAGSSSTDFASCIKLASAPHDWNATISCPATHPNAVAGNCSTSCRMVTTNLLTGNTQTCELLPGGNMCVNPGQYSATATIVCCP